MTYVTCSTKLAAEGTSVSTSVTIDWTGVTEQQFIALATKQVIIAVQKDWRTLEHIPAKATVVVKTMRPARKNAKPADVSVIPVEVLIAEMKRRGAWIPEPKLDDIGNDESETEQTE